jgi:hypothetical protein
MDILENKTDQEIIRSLVGEAAKAQNEVRCAQRDLEKAQSRLSFILVLANKMIERQGD